MNLIRLIIIIEIFTRLSSAAQVTVIDTGIHPSLEWSSFVPYVQQSVTDDIQGGPIIRVTPITFSAYFNKLEVMEFASVLVEFLGVDGASLKSVGFFYRRPYSFYGVWKLCEADNSGGSTKRELGWISLPQGADVGAAYIKMMTKKFPSALWPSEDNVDEDLTWLQCNLFSEGLRAICDDWISLKTRLVGKKN